MNMTTTTMADTSDRRSPSEKDNSDRELGGNDLIGETKTAHNLTATDHDVEIQNGHLAELEVDITGVLSKAEEEGSWDADTSPFPAVRAVVPEYDDPAIPVNTFRAWFLGIVCKPEIKGGEGERGSLLLGR